MRNISPAAWSKLGKLSLILSALVVGNIVKNKLSEEEYPINLLEDEFSKGTNNIIKMELRVLVSVR